MRTHETTSLPTAKDRPPGTAAPSLQHRVQQWRRRVVLWTAALVAGGVAVGFAALADLAQRAFLAASASWAGWRWVAPPLGLALVTLIAVRVVPGSHGSGIPQTIAALGAPAGAARRRLLSMRIAIGKLALTTSALACGASVGREGPSVQIGASILYAARRWARFPRADLHRGLILAGGAAGVAAAFNTPLAGIVFAIEELSRSFEERTSGTILTAVVLAGVAAVALVGDYTYFGTTTATLDTWRHWAVVPLCGIAGGLAGGLFARAMIALQRDLPRPIAAVRANSPVAFAFACGLLVAVIGWLSAGETFGTGYAQARQLVLQPAEPAAGFAALKAAATLVSYLSGVPGGIFAPSLAVGAALGGELAPWLPAAPGGAVVVITMAAYFAGVVQAPLTALVIVTEMTGDRALTLPLMAAVFLGRAASALVCREALYRALAQAFVPSRTTTSERVTIGDPVR